MEFLAFSDFEERFGFIDDIEEFVDDFTKPQFVAFDDDDLCNIRIGLMMAEDDLWMSLSNINNDVISRDELISMLSSIRKFLEITQR